MMQQLMYVVALLLPLWVTGCADDEPMVVRSHFTEEEWKEWRGDALQHLPRALDAKPDIVSPPEVIAKPQSLTLSDGPYPDAEPGVGQGSRPDPTRGSEAPEPAPPPASETSKVDLNTADLEALMSLPGVGPSLGQRILDYRQKRRFRRVRDLRRVRGIGAGKFLKIKSLVEVTPN